MCQLWTKLRIYQGTKNLCGRILLNQTAWFGILWLAARPGKLLNLFMPPFPHLKNEVNSFSLKVFWGLNEHYLKMIRALADWICLIYVSHRNHTTTTTINIIIIILPRKKKRLIYKASSEDRRLSPKRNVFHQASHSFFKRIFKPQKPHSNIIIMLCVIYFYG